MNSRLRITLLAAIGCFSASATPQLRLGNSVIYSQTDVGASPSPQTVYAYNNGDGALNLTLSLSPAVAWLNVSIAPEPSGVSYCPALVCSFIIFNYNTSSLSRGVYTTTVAVSDPNAIDAPQVITVTLYVGASTMPIDVYVKPGGYVAVPMAPYFEQNDGLRTSTQNGGSWLSFASYLEGTISITDYNLLYVAPAASLPVGTYSGSVGRVSVASPGVIYSVPVTMNVSTQPIAVPSMTQIAATLVQGGPPITYPFQPYISLSNSGMGTLTVQDVTGSGSGVSAYNYNGLAIVTLDPGSLGVGTYTDGVVTFQCNAANCPLQIPLTLKITPRGPPVLNYQGAMANSGGSPGGTVAPGEVMIVQGQQLSNQPAVIASTYPLQKSLGETSVWVNGSPAPLYYSSAGQIAFQMPSSAVPGSALVQVQRDDGQSSNFISVPVQPLAPQIVVVTDANYNLVDSTHAIAAGGTLVIWAIGLGPTSPAVPDGAAAPSSPLAQTVTTPTIRLSGSEFAPTFCGLAPGEAGLYQVIVKLPSTLKGNVLLTIAEPGSAAITSTFILVQ